MPAGDMNGGMTGMPDMGDMTGGMPDMPAGDTTGTGDMTGGMPAGDMNDNSQYDDQHGVTVPYTKTYLK
jgi:hypothetical protein